MQYWELAYSGESTVSDGQYSAALDFVGYLPRSLPLFFAT